MTWPDHEPTYRDPTRSIDVAASLEASKRQNAEGCVKTWEDLERYRMLLDYYQPDWIVELGTFSGKSALWLAHHGGCGVITVDVDPVEHHEPGMSQRFHDQGVYQIVGSSIDPDVVAQVHNGLATRGSVRPLIVCDSWHSGPHVEAELELYHDLTPLWGYIVVEDGIIRWNEFETNYYGGSGPLDGIEAFTRRHTNWSSDKDIEYLHPTTQHPEGWLVRRA